MGNFLSQAGQSIIAFLGNTMELVMQGLQALTSNGWTTSLELSNTGSGIKLNVSFIRFNAKVKDQTIPIAANPNQTLEDIIFMISERTKISKDNQCIELDGNFGLLKR